MLTGPLSRCMSAFSCHAKTNKLFDTSLCLLLCLTGRETLVKLSSLWHSVKERKAEPKKPNVQKTIFGKVPNSVTTESAGKKIGKNLEESKKIEKKLFEDKNFIFQLPQLQLKCSTVKMQKCTSFQSKLRTASIQ